MFITFLKIVKIKNQKPSKPTATSKPQQSNIEDKKADIERRRQKSLSKINPQTKTVLSTGKERITSYKGAYFPKGYIDENDWQMTEVIERKNKQDLIEEINAKYDAELKALESENNLEKIRKSENNSVSLQENNSDSTNVEFYDTEETLTKQIQDITEQLSKTTSKVIKSALEVKLKELNEKLNTLKLQSKPEGFINEYQKKDTVENKEVIKTKSESQVIKDVENLTRLNTMFNKTGKLPEVLQKQYDELKQEYVEEYNKLPKKCEL